MNFAAMPGPLVLALALALCAGCAVAPLHFYRGAAKPVDQLALFSAGEPAVLDRVDGRKVPRLESDLALLPGPRRIEFQVIQDHAATRTDVGGMRMHCAALVEMKRGDTYTLRSRFERDADTPSLSFHWVIWIVEESSGREAREHVPFSSGRPRVTEIGQIVCGLDPEEAETIELPIPAA